ncbi:hypothetical protein GGF46_004101 [Coemansia sp. RSA 552]|nr:hypothetical protein GGF46_004101 [Coemansia sp. RSA 552]
MFKKRSTQSTSAWAVSSCHPALDVGDLEPLPPEFGEISSLPPSFQAPVTEDFVRMLRDAAFNHHHHSELNWFNARSPARLRLSCLVSYLGSCGPNQVVWVYVRFREVIFAILYSSFAAEVDRLNTLPERFISPLDDQLAGLWAPFACLHRLIELLPRLVATGWKQSEIENMLIVLLDHGNNQDVRVLGLYTLNLYMAALGGNFSDQTIDLFTNAISLRAFSYVDMPAASRAVGDIMCAIGCGADVPSIGCGQRAIIGFQVGRSSICPVLQDSVYPINPQGVLALRMLRNMLITLAYLASLVPDPQAAYAQYIDLGLICVQSRPFHFGRNMFESTYDMPQAIPFAAMSKAFKDRHTRRVPVLGMQMFIDFMLGYLVPRHAHMISGNEFYMANMGSPSTNSKPSTPSTPNFEDRLAVGLESMGSRSYGDGNILATALSGYLEHVYGLLTWLVDDNDWNKKKSLQDIVQLFLSKPPAEHDGWLGLGDPVSATAVQLKGLYMVPTVWTGHLNAWCNVLRALTIARGRHILCVDERTLIQESMFSGQRQRRGMNKVDKYMEELRSPLYHLRDEPSPDRLETSVPFSITSNMTWETMRIVFATAKDAAREEATLLEACLHQIQNTESKLANPKSDYQSKSLLRTTRSIYACIFLSGQKNLSQITGDMLGESFHQSKTDAVDPPRMIRKHSGRRKIRLPGGLRRANNLSKSRQGHDSESIVAASEPISPSAASKGTHVWERLASPFRRKKHRTTAGPTPPPQQQQQQQQATGRKSMTAIAHSGPPQKQAGDHNDPNILGIDAGILAHSRWNSHHCLPERSGEEPNDEDSRSESMVSMHMQPGEHSGSQIGPAHFVIEGNVSVRMPKTAHQQPKAISQATSISLQKADVAALNRLAAISLLVRTRKRVWQLEAVWPDTHVSDYVRVRGDIVANLQQLWLAWIGLLGSPVDVGTVRSKVILRGLVKSWDVYRAVLDCSRYTPDNDDVMLNTSCWVAKVAAKYGINDYRGRLAQAALFRMGCRCSDHINSRVLFLRSRFLQSALIVLSPLVNGQSVNVDQIHMFLTECQLLLSLGISGSRMLLLSLERGLTRIFSAHDILLELAEDHALNYSYKCREFVEGTILSGLTIVCLTELGISDKRLPNARLIHNCLTAILSRLFSEKFEIIRVAITDLNALLIGQTDFVGLLGVDRARRIAIYIMEAIVEQFDRTTGDMVAATALVIRELIQLLITVLIKAPGIIVDEADAESRQVRDFLVEEIFNRCANPSKAVISNAHQYNRSLVSKKSTHGTVLELEPSKYSPRQSMSLGDFMRSANDERKSVADIAESLKQMGEVLYITLMAWFDEDSRLGTHGFTRGKPENSYINPGTEEDFNNERTFFYSHGNCIVKICKVPGTELNKCVVRSCTGKVALQVHFAPEILGSSGHCTYSSDACMMWLNPIVDKKAVVDRSGADAGIPVIRPLKMNLFRSQVQRNMGFGAQRTNMNYYLPLVKSEALYREILSLDQMHAHETLKIALFYVGPGQWTESEILSNTPLDTSMAYRSFVRSLGWMVDLKTFDGFTGKLGADGSDGITCPYFFDDGIEVVFHEATSMPTDKDDTRQLKKKRHIGNDHVHVIFNESNHNYRPETISGDFGNVQIQIRPLEPGEYGIGLYCDDQVKPFGPLSNGMVVSADVLPAATIAAVQITKQGFGAAIYDALAKQISVVDVGEGLSTDMPIQTSTYGSVRKAIPAESEEFEFILGERRLAHATRVIEDLQITPAQAKMELDRTFTHTHRSSSLEKIHERHEAIGSLCAEEYAAMLDDTRAILSKFRPTGAACLRIQSELVTSDLEALAQFSYAAVKLYHLIESIGDTPKLLQEFLSLDRSIFVELGCLVIDTVDFDASRNEERVVIASGISNTVDRLRETFSSLDMLLFQTDKQRIQSLATVAKLQGYCRPQFNTDGCYHISQGWHPLLDRCIPNDLHLLGRNCKHAESSRAGMSRTLILLGPHMSGKSVLAKQTGITVYLAHVGSYVPAEGANIALTGRIMTMGKASESLAQQQSALRADLKAVAAILNKLHIKTMQFKASSTGLVYLYR